VSPEEAGIMQAFGNCRGYRCPEKKINDDGSEMRRGEEQRPRR
jgi:hypothetical protein